MVLHGLHVGAPPKKVYLYQMSTYFLNKYEDHYGATTGLFNKGLT